MRRVILNGADTRTGHLILVTPDRGLSEEGRPASAVPVRYVRDYKERVFCSGQGNCAAGEKEDVLLEPETAGRLSGLLQELGSGDRIVLVSGLRSREEQVRIWEDTMEKEGEAFTRTFVAKPGHSEHESGLAVDLAENREEIDFICPEFPGEGICGEFRRRASRYGFVERYPEGKEAVTGIGREPWHFRYVGVPHGAVMEREGMILEEYIAFLRKYTSEAHPYLWYGPGKGEGTEIFYVDLRGKEEYAFRSGGPKDVWYSGTNEGGIVICRRRAYV